MTEYLSKKITIISFILMIMIVVLHAQLITLSSGICKTIQLIITGQITRIAVPLFFLISGYLFFRNFQGQIFHFWKIKLKKRIYSILIPYLIFSILGYCFTLGLHLFFPSRIEYDNSITNIFYTIFLHPVGTYQLWFLRDLFIIVLFSPVIYYLLKYLKIIIIICFTVTWIMGVNCVIATEAITFFSIGSYIALYNQNLTLHIVKNKIIPYLFTTLWITICILVTHWQLNYAWHCFGIICGIIALWTLYDLIYPKLNHHILNSHVYSFSFFIYLVHEPLLTIIKKILYLISGSQLIFVIYIIAPIICIITCIILGNILKKNTPKVYYILTGGR